MLHVLVKIRVMQQRGSALHRATAERGVTEIGMHKENQREGETGFSAKLKFMIEVDSRKT